LRKKLWRALLKLCYEICGCSKARSRLSVSYPQQTTVGSETHLGMDGGMSLYVNDLPRIVLPQQLVIVRRGEAEIRMTTGRVQEFASCF